jgi:hypothetical protein
MEDREYSELDLYDEIKQAFPTLSQEESEAALVLAEERIAAQGTTLERYMKYRYPAGLSRRFDQTADNHPDKYLQHLPEDAKKLVETGETGGFPAFVAASASIFRRQLKSKLLERAEQAFAVKNGEWTVEREERFAEGFEEYIRTKNAKDGRLENVYKKAPEFFQNIYKRLDCIIDISPNVRSGYETLFQPHILKNGKEDYIFNQQQYEARLRNIAAGRKEGMWVDLGITPPIYERLAFPRRVLMTTQAHLENIMREKDMFNPQRHGLSVDILKQIPEKLKKPILILQSDTNPEDIVSVVELLDKDNAPLVAPIAHNRSGIYNHAKIQINHVKSIYGKDGNFIAWRDEAIKENRILYMNKKISRTFPRSDPSSVRLSGASILITDRLQLPADQDVSGFYIKNIARYKEIVKGFSEKTQKNSFQENAGARPAKEANMDGHSQHEEYGEETGGGEPLHPKEEFAARGAAEPEEPAKEAGQAVPKGLEAETRDEEARNFAEPASSGFEQSEGAETPGAEKGRTVSEGVEDEEEAWKSDAEKGVDLMREYTRLSADSKSDERSLQACRSAVSGHWYMLKHIDPQFKTHGVCMDAVGQSGRALQFVEKGGLEKEELFEICETAARKNPEAIRWVKDEFGFDGRDMAALCVAAVKSDVSALRCMKEEWKTQAVLERAIEENGLALERVKPEDRSAELCAKAVGNNPLALKYAPEKAQAPEMCAAAVKSAGAVLRHVREDLKTPELCLEAVRRRGSALEYVPEPLQTPEMRLTSVRQNGYNLRYAREQTSELCLEAVRRRGGALKYVKEKMPEVCLEAVKEDRGALIHLFPEGARPVDNSPQSFEANVKALVAERKFAAKDAAGILRAGMEEEDRGRLASFLEEKLKADETPSLAKLFEKWEAEARFPNSLGTEGFYKHPDAAVKEARYSEHLKESLRKGYEQPVFSIGEEKGGSRGALLAKLFGKDSRASPDRLLNPFSPDAVERMKEAAKIGVVFADERRRDAQLAFMKEHLPEVHKIVMETLRRQERPAPLVIGGARTERGRSQARKPAGPDRGR